MSSEERRETDFNSESKPAEITVLDVLGDIKVMKFGEGFMDLSTSEAIKQSFEKHYYKEAKFLFDLNNVSFMDSEGIKSILACIRVIRAARSSAAIVCSRRSKPFRALKLSGIVETLPVFEDIQQGIENLE
ncbi:MAG: STAS domain-containing protein [Patescibacteria group bacterium]|nr:STAS domain-containing protein [Patescibacteria group bacterium]